MRRGVLVVAVLAASACTGGDNGVEAADDLRRLAKAGEAVTYEASYTWKISGPLADAASYGLAVARRPPDDLRTVRMVTPTKDGGTYVYTSWYASQGGKTFACEKDADQPATCREGGSLARTFGIIDIDEMIDLPTTPGAIEEVERAGDRRIAGRKASCFSVTPPKPSPVPVSSPQPRYVPDFYMFELCYSPEGVLLRAKRTLTGDVPDDIRTENRDEGVLEAEAVSNSVTDEDLALPAPVPTPDPE